MQDDDQAVVFELAPMNSCAYTWDNPMGKKKLRVAVIPKSQSREYMLEEAVNEREEASSKVMSVATSDCEEPISTSDDETDGIHPLLQSPTNDPVEAQAKIRALNKTTPYRTRRRRALHTHNARVYSLLKIGRHKDLPCPSPKDPEMKYMTMKSHLVSHSRIVAGRCGCGLRTAKQFTNFRMSKPATSRDEDFKFQRFDLDRRSSRSRSPAEGWRLQESPVRNKHSGHGCVYHG